MIMSDNPTITNKLLCKCGSRAEKTMQHLYGWADDYRIACPACDADTGWCAEPGIAASRWDAINA